MARRRRWDVGITDGAQEDLRRLRKRRRPVWREAVTLMERLRDEAATMGDSLRPPFPSGVRRVHFGRDKYRMAWFVNDAAGTADVLAVDLKSNRFYDRLLERVEGVLDRFRQPIRSSRGPLVRGLGYLSDSAPAAESNDA